MSYQSLQHLDSFRIVGHIARVETYKPYPENKLYYYIYVSFGSFAMLQTIKMMTKKIDMDKYFVFLSDRNSYAVICDNPMFTDTKSLTEFVNAINSIYKGDEGVVTTAIDNFERNELGLQNHGLR